MKGLENDDDYPSPAPTYEAISSLQQDLEAERNSRKEERFIWFFVLILVLDVFTFKDMETWSGPLMVGILEIILVVALGRRWSMDHIYTITELIINKWNGKFRPE
ncbi:hypothetical protein C7477_105152 [Phyllobacterium leguminum]|uniref:Transmembrane protein n=2 Tax=Phyllobacterium leguminum TaxID=314237 RepID=A0A318T4C0_9HYPH|nr:hypothetical protein C7477_105152 [Phyllobacterium leguminum]